MDGKHILIKQPKNSGSYYFNYKGTFSIVLLALVDADYKFLYVDVRCNGRICDGRVYRNSSLCDAIQNNFLNIPKPRLLDDSENNLPYVIVGDDAFPLKENIMKPYPFRSLSHEKRIFIYRLSRARRIVENAFGILANRFRLFLSSILLEPEIVEKITVASCALHNFLREKIPLQYSPPGTFDSENLENRSTQNGEWRNNLESLQSIRVSASNNYTTDAKKIRDDFCRYFNTNGSVPWQDDFI